MRRRQQTQRPVHSRPPDTGRPKLAARPSTQVLQLTQTKQTNYFKLKKLSRKKLFAKTNAIFPTSRQGLPLCLLLAESFSKTSFLPEVHSPNSSPISEFGLTKENA